MVVANTLAYYDTATIAAVKSTSPQHNPQDINQTSLQSFVEDKYDLFGRNMSKLPKQFYNIDKVRHFNFQNKKNSDKILRLFEHNVRKWSRAKILKAIVLSKRGIGGGDAIKLFFGGNKLACFSPIRRNKLACLSPTTFFCLPNTQSYRDGTFSKNHFSDITLQLIVMCWHLQKFLSYSLILRVAMMEHSAKNAFSEKTLQLIVMCQHLQKFLHHSQSLFGHGALLQS